MRSREISARGPCPPAKSRADVRAPRTAMTKSERRKVARACVAKKRASMRAAEKQHTARCAAHGARRAVQNGHGLSPALPPCPRCMGALHGSSAWEPYGGVAMLPDPSLPWPPPSPIPSPPSLLPRHRDTVSPVPDRCPTVRTAAHREPVLRTFPLKNETFLLKKLLEY